MVKQFRELTPAWRSELARLPFMQMRHAIEKKQREVKAVKMTALGQKADLQSAISQLEEIEEECDINQSQSQTMFQDLISKMDQDIEFIQSTQDRIRFY